MAAGKRGKAPREFPNQRSKGSPTVDIANFSRSRRRGKRSHRGLTRKGRR